MLRKKPFIDFVNEMLEAQVASEKAENHIDSRNADNSYGVDAVGVSTTAFGAMTDKSVGNLSGVDNLMYDESKWVGRGAQGFAAERANNLYDRVRGVDARITGDNNVANGPDRVLINYGEKVWIQSKYCNNGNLCIDKCFKDGKYRYYEDGKPMQVEVPSNTEIYDQAVARMEYRISKGQVPGVTDPSQAKNLVRRGTVSYEQAVNIAKAGTVDSLIYDTVNGMVISTSAFGVSVLVSFAVSIWNGESVDDAISKAAAAGIKVGGVALCTTVLSSQLYKAGAAKPQMINGRTALVREIDWNYTDELGRTNLQRVREGLSPLDPASGKAYELHHIGQKADSTLAILTKSEHMQNGNDLIWHNKAIPSAVHNETNEALWEAQKAAFWKTLAKIAEGAM